MTALAPERLDTVHGDPTCQVEDKPGDPLCGAPAVADILMSCPWNHPEGFLVCARHLALARDGKVFCNDCRPTTIAFIIAEVRL